ncbi:ATP/GTP-binding protein [Kineosporia sp. NBRC 101731]|uniref:ATP/GTP-binding protein n=1 Tax=Kineosporia mesophila TaxID=566012 RepID=A0ABP6ZBH4_9ACTN|nr:ATP/GTP-binding protein [Kineosporia sp. NBRC 101731]GLY27480.1 ATP-binding protein [Kineosporia sp. NBRC 101731]
MSLHSETRNVAGGQPDGGKRPPIPVKILISGGFGVGKTTTVGALSEIDPLSTEAPMTSASIGVDDAGVGSQKTTTTVAMDFGRITIDESIILYMFGTPGQDRFGFMWNDLAEGALGGVVLVDPSRMEECFVALDYFENIQLPYVVAVNTFAGRESLTLDQVRHAVNVDPDVPVVAVDARDREQVKAVVLTLLRRILARAKNRTRG